MKHTISLSLLSFMLVLSISCSKDEAMPSIGSSQVRQDVPILLTATAWTADQSGRFVCSFANFMHTAGDANAAAIARVYLITDNDEIIISFGAITYMSGQLWSEQEGNDLKVYYEPFTAQTVLPFSTLNLKVE